MSVYAAYLGSLYFFTDKAPSHINVAFMATGLVSSYLATKVRPMPPKCAALALHLPVLFDA